MAHDEGEADLSSTPGVVAFDDDFTNVPLPTTLPVLPLRGAVVFPSGIVPLLISRRRSLEVVEAALQGDRLVAVVAQKIPEDDDPGPEGLFARGSAGRILKVLKYPDGSVRVLVQGLRRIELLEYEDAEPFLRAQVRALPDRLEDLEGIDSARSLLVSQFGRYVSMISYLPDELQVVANKIPDPGKVADMIASNLNVSLEEKQELISVTDVRQRIGRLTTILHREIEMLELGQKIQSQVQTELTKSQKEFYLRQQLRAIQKELGEQDPRSGEVDELTRRLEAANPPPAARKAAEQELERLRLIPVESAEHGVVRNYLEWLVGLPWNVATEDNLDIGHARQVLDEDHFGLEKVKDRVLEFLAVRQLKADSKGPILCFAGPPGVGKTSLGRSIARALGRKFVRLSLGGVRDEAEVRGHRRTYVGALPGRLIQNLRTAGSNNPLVMLDEIDKLGGDFRGDPASALLEVLDPEQNAEFVDHYLDVPFDLSRVLFVTTANQLDPIPPPLRDRMEVIELAGYTEEEKLQIAVSHLVPKQTAENGLGPEQVGFTEEGLRHLIRHHTREAGLRNLEREIGSICRKVARAVTEGRREPTVVDAARVRELLGPEKFFSEVAERTAEAGVAVGLAWTPMGGDIMFIESTRMAGKKGLLLTGQLGDVMKESAHAALSFIRSHAAAYGIEPAFFEEVDLHVHVPAGAVPKDGPSAGVTIATSLVSLLSGRRVRNDVAMTGEITLRGKVLPVGGIKEKVLGARRAGILSVILPKRNVRDLDDVPEVARREMTFHPVESIDEVLELALVPVTASRVTAVGS